jgi:DNA-binding MarR family transcriptional regulator
MVVVKGQDEELHLVALLERLWRRVKAELDSAARQLAPDLRPSHVRLLSITPAAGMRLGDLAGKASMTAQSLGEFVDTLCRTGYAEVVPDPADGRARLVRPTDRGQQIGHAMTERVRQLEELYSHEVSPRQWRSFRGVLVALDGRPARSASQ